jgi:hypothetical protein
MVQSSERDLRLSTLCALAIPTRVTAMSAGSSTINIVQDGQPDRVILTRKHLILAPQRPPDSRQIVFPPASLKLLLAELSVREVAMVY